MRPRKIDFYCPRWGSEALHWEDFFIRLKLNGYEGMEWAVSREVSHKELDQVFTLAGAYKIKVIAQHYDTTESDFYEHLDRYARWLEKMKDYPMVKLNSQTGKDYFSFEDNKILIELGNEFGREQEIPVVHETHRGKFSFAAHITKDYLKSLPKLRLTLDLSHWVCVAESLLDDQLDALTLAAARTDHIHARVGYTQGPQVTNPMLEVWAEPMATHLNWWDMAIACQRRDPVKEAITITTEFGPYPYMVRTAGGKDLASQWDINVWMKNLLRARYQ